MIHLFKREIKSIVLPSDTTGTVYRVHITTVPSKTAKWFGCKEKEYSGAIFLTRNKWYTPVLGGEAPRPMPEKLIPMFNKTLDAWLLQNWGEENEDKPRRVLSDKAPLHAEVKKLDEARETRLDQKRPNA